MASWQTWSAAVPLKAAPSLGAWDQLSCSSTGRGQGTRVPESIVELCAGTKGGTAISHASGAGRDGLFPAPVAHGCARAVCLLLPACPSLTPSPPRSRAAACLAALALPWVQVLPRAGAGEGRQWPWSCLSPSMSPSPAAGQDSRQQPRQGRHSPVALPALLGTAVPMTGPCWPHPCAPSVDQAGAKITGVPALLAAHPSAPGMWPGLPSPAPPCQRQHPTRPGLWLPAPG